MSRGLGIDLTLPLHRFTLSVRWATEEGALGLFGPSGAGKTTLMESLAGLRGAARGVIRVGGRTWLDTERGIRWPPERRGIGYVPQDPLLFPHWNVSENLLAGRRRAAMIKRPPADPRRVMEVLDLETIAGRDVRMLSGGERRRVALGRALCSGPELLLLDEPLAHLDPGLRQKVLSYLFSIREEFAIPTIHVSHDATELKALCREVMVIDAGRMIAHGPPDELFAIGPVLPLTRGEGFENVVRGVVSAVSGSIVTVDLAPGARVAVASPGFTGQGLDGPGGADRLVGREVVLAARAEELILATQTPAGLSAQNILAGEVSRIVEAAPEAGGDGQLLVGVAVARLPSPLFATITADAKRRLALREGMPIHIVCKAHSFRILARR